MIWLPVASPGVYAGYVAVNLMEISVHVLGQDVDEGQFESYKACQLAFRTYWRDGLGLAHMRVLDPIYCRLQK